MRVPLPACVCRTGLLSTRACAAVHICKGGHHRTSSSPGTQRSFRPILCPGANMDVVVHVTGGRGDSDSNWQVLGQMLTHKILASTIAP